MIPISGDKHGAYLRGLMYGSSLPCPTSVNGGREIHFLVNGEPRVLVLPDPTPTLPPPQPLDQFLLTQLIDDDTYGFLKWEDDSHFRHRKEDGSQYTLAEADGVWFACPKCWLACTKYGEPGSQWAGRKIGVHGVMCWEPNVPQTTHPIPGRWQMLGTGLHDLTLKAGSSSVLLTGEGGCKAHFFITNGRILMC